jgi:hypothetical protein
MRQCSRSTSVAIVALAFLRFGSSVINPLAASLACCRFFGATGKVHDFVDATMASLAGDGGPNVANFLQGISWYLGVGLVGHGYKYAF